MEVKVKVEEWGGAAPPTPVFFVSVACKEVTGGIFRKCGF